jgi:hypothetical protein
MKKVIVFFVFMAFVATFSFGESRETQIANSIEKARYVNYLMGGVKDPDKIQPGQTIFVPIIVKEGDTEWWIFDRTLPWGSEMSSDTTVYYNEESTPATDPGLKTPGNERSFLLVIPQWREISDFIFNNLVWFLLILFVLVIIVLTLTSKKFRDFMNGDLFAKKEEKSAKFSSDPTKEGRPFVSDGVENENQADKHFVNLARISNPGLNPSNVVIKERKRVYVSTPNGESAIVEFADGSKDSFSFQNVPGWVAMVSTDGGKNFKREIFFQDCGNPVYSRTSMRDAGLIITDEPIKFGNTESENLTPVVEEKKAEVTDKKVVEVETKKVVTEEKQVTPSGSETFQIQMKILNIAEKAAEGNLHSVILELDADGKLKTSINYKSEAGGKNEKTEGKLN